MALTPLVSKTRPRDFGRTLCDEQVASTATAKNACVDRMVGLLQAQGAVRGEQEWTHARLVLDELLVNAMEHGHGWAKTKRVRVQLMADGSRWGVRVEDRGQGFDPRAVPDPRAPDAVLRDRGRGLLLVQALMDSVRYYDRGRGVLAVRRVPRGRRSRI